MHFKLTRDEKDLYYIQRYLSFIRQCLQPKGNFLNFVDKANKFTDQNKTTNLDDANGRAVWALGYMVSLIGLLPWEIISEAITLFEKSLRHIGKVHSTRAMAFAMKGLYYYRNSIDSPKNLFLLKTFANRLVQMYRHKSNEEWQWFEGYLTYANSILPEAILYAWLLSGETIYKDIARSSFGFLLSQTFNDKGIEVISNKRWQQKLQKETPIAIVGEQPIEVAYTTMTLSTFYDAFKDDDYHLKMETAFNLFLGNNRLHQIIYNPCTGGCYDGLEEMHVNLNQGASSTISFLMARLTIEQYSITDIPFKEQLQIVSVVSKQ